MKFYQSFDEIQADLNTNSITCRKIVETYLDRIQNHHHLNAFLDVYTEEALQQADQIDHKLKTKSAGKLAGMVIGVKDVICYKNHFVRASSKILDKYRSPFTATALERLIQEDAIIIGNLNCDEFAMGSSNENSAFGVVKNPLNTDTVPGGSSGGSAAAVAAHLCLTSLGSDTGGSIRQPASFCGLTGIKPTYGRISRYGLIAYASSFDQIGPFAHLPADAARVLEVMNGVDSNDSTTSTHPKFQYTEYANADVKKTKVGVLRQAIEVEGLDPEIRNAFDKSVQLLKHNGLEVEFVDFPFLEYLIPTYYILTTAEASSNLSRFDGVRYGYRDETAKTLEQLYAGTRSKGFGMEVQRRIMLGTFVLSAGYFDAYYKKAQKIRRILQNETQKILSEFDFILSPTTPTPAFNIGDKSKDPISMYLSDIFTVHANLTGNPALSVPNALHSNGLPIGIHALGRFFDEGRLLKLGDLLYNKQ